MGEVRYIGRANVAKRLRALEGAPARTVYAGGSVRIELDESVLTVTPPFGLDHEGVTAGPGLQHRGAVGLGGTEGLAQIRHLNLKRVGGITW